MWDCIAAAPWLCFFGTLWHFEELPACSEEAFGLLVGTNYINNTSSELAGELQPCCDVLLDVSLCRALLKTLLLMLQPWLQCRPNFQLFSSKSFTLAGGPGLPA